MLREMARSRRSITITDALDSTSVSGLGITPIEGGKVRLTWRWPRDNEYNRAFVFEISEGEDSDIESILKAVLSGGNIVDNVVSKDNFNFHFDIMPINKRVRFAIYPFKYDKNGGIIIPKQNKENNISAEIIRKITASYSVEKYPLRCVGGMLGAFLDRLQGRNSFYNYVRVVITINKKDISEIKRNEKFVYYEIKSKEDKIHRYCADLSIVGDNNFITFYMEKDSDVCLVSGPRQNIDYKKIQRSELHGQKN